MAIPGGPQGEVLLNFLLQDSLRYSVSLDKDRYLTPAPNLRSTSASHDSQYTIYMAYSDALKNSFFPRTIPYSLPSSVVSSKTAEEFKALILTGTPLSQKSDLYAYRAGTSQGSYLDQGFRGIRFSMPLSTGLASCK